VKDIGYELLQLLSNVFNEPVDKGNLKSVLERQGNLNISFGERSVNSNIIGCINMGLEKPLDSSEPSQKNHLDSQECQNQTQLETIKKLRQFSLSDEQIAEALELPLEVIKQVKLEE
jgi:hypothetical protein